MRFMNSWDIVRALDLYADHPVLGPASRTVANVADWTNRNSDGWAYWPKPVRACAKVMEMIERDGTNAFYGGPREDATADEYARALRPVKAFRTRHGADFVIEEVASSASPALEIRAMLVPDRSEAYAASGMWLVTDPPKAVPPAIREHTARTDEILAEVRKARVLSEHRANVGEPQLHEEVSAWLAERG